MSVAMSVAMEDAKAKVLVSYPTAESMTYRAILGPVWVIIQHGDGPGIIGHGGTEEGAWKNAALFHG